MVLHEHKGKLYCAASDLYDRLSAAPLKNSAISFEETWWCQLLEHRKSVFNNRKAGFWCFWSTSCLSYAEQIEQNIKKVSVLQQAALVQLEEEQTHAEEIGLTRTPRLRQRPPRRCPRGLLGSSGCIRSPKGSWAC